MKYIFIFMPFLANSQSLWSPDQPPPTIYYEKVQTNKVDCVDFYIGTFQFLEKREIVVFWLLPEYSEEYNYAQPATRWDGRKWHKETPCLYKWGGKVKCEIDYILPRQKHLKSIF